MQQASSGWDPAREPSCLSYWLCSQSPSHNLVCLHISTTNRSLGASALSRMPPSLHGLKPGPPYASHVPRRWATPGPVTILWVGTPMPSYSRHWYNNDVIHWTSCKASVCGCEGDWLLGTSTRAWVWIRSPHEKLAQQCTAAHSRNFSSSEAEAERLTKLTDQLV